jgi:hypothetical protein
MIYFAQRPDNGNIKIGTTIRLSERLKVLSRELGLELQLLGVVDGGYADEHALHTEFAHLRVEGEWFKPDFDLIGFIKAESRKWDGTDDITLDLISVKMDVKVVKDCRIAATYKGMSLTDYLSESMREVVDQDIEEGHARWRTIKQKESP